MPRRGATRTFARSRVSIHPPARPDACNFPDDTSVYEIANKLGMGRRATALLVEQAYANTVTVCVTARLRAR
jgi:hypothetical protein